MRATLTFRRTFRQLSALAVAAVAILGGDRAAAQPSMPILVFGSPGTGLGQLAGPGRVALDSAGNIYVLEFWNSRVQVFSSSGAPSFFFGSEGSGAGQFDQPTDIAVAADGSIYVTDSGNFRVQKFSPAGMHQLSFGSQGQGPGQFFNQVMSLALDADGNVYVGSVFQLQKFSPNGALLKVYELGGILPKSLAIAPNGDIVMYQKDNGTIDVYDSDGNEVRRFSGGGCNMEQGFGCSTDHPGAIEPGDGELRNEAAVAVDALGNVYVADSGNARIQKFSADGVFLWKFGGSGENPGQFGQNDGPRGLVVDASGRIIVADTDNHRVQVFDDPRTITIADQSVVEGDNGKVEAVFTVTLSAPSVSPVSVEYKTVDGTAQAGDYVPAGATLTFAPGETTATIIVLIEGDAAHEPDETFSVGLLNPDGATLADAEATGTIVNDDAEEEPGDDTTPPSISIVSPQAGNYVLNEPLTAGYSCADAESLVELCEGPAANGSPMSPAVGTHVFHVNARDSAGNQSSASVTYTVSYAVCLLYDASAPVRIGPPARIKVALCDANGRIVSQPSVRLTAIELVNMTTGEVLTPRSAQPPGNMFHYAPWPGENGYVFMLITKGVPAGEYELRFRAGVDPALHAAPLRLR